ncbi:helix-turn-helix domain-containing protein [Herbaspirillum frisingense]|uniref:helix-turn-helix domain-containing protein n=1 Tax=Herbaspirillum frisingense TaxID=92645 RepID=UPI00398C3745
MFRPQPCSCQRAGERSDRRGPTWSYSTLVHPDRISIREIARRLDISRNTVRRYIRSNAIEPSYSTRRSTSALDPFTPRLSAWLSAEAVKSRKQRRTLKQMFLDLKALGYQGSYDRVAAFGRQWKVGQMERVNSASKSTHARRIPSKLHSIC